MRFLSKKIESNLIFSPLTIEPSPIDIIDSLELKADKFVDISQIRSYAIESLPPQEVAEIFTSKQEYNYSSILNRLRDFINSVECLDESEERQTWLPIGELHRPNCSECTATLKTSSSSNDDYSLSVKLSGIGGGVTISRKVGFSQSITAKNECLQIRLPVTYTVQKCKPKNGETFTRVNPKDIGTILNTKKLNAEEDRCGISVNQINKAGWKKNPIEILTDETRSYELSSESSQAAELSLDISTEDESSIGLKSVTKLIKSHSYSYELKGPCRFLAYFPKNSVSWYWTKL